MPTKDLSISVPVYCSGSYTDVRGSTATQYAQNGMSSSRIGGSATGVSNPNWRVQVLKGQDASTNYSRAAWELKPSTGKFRFQTVQSSYSQFGEWSFGTIPNDLSSVSSDSINAGLQDLALTRLKRKLASEAGHVNDLVPLVELREMRELVHSLAERCTVGISHWANLLSRRRALDARRAIREAQDTWLTFSFGISPTVSAVRDAAEHIAAYMLRTDRVVRVHGGARSTWNTVSSVVGRPLPGAVGIPLYSGPGFAPLRIQKQLDYLYVGCFDLQLKSSNDYGALASFGFVPERLPSVGWELLPYSWVIDYFTNVGQFLDDTFIVPPGSTKYLFVNRKYAATFQYAAVVDFTRPATGSFSCSTDASDCVGRYDEFQRTVLTSLPHIGLRLKSTDEIGNYAVSKLLNLASLLHFKSKR